MTTLVANTSKTSPKIEIFDVFAYNRTIRSIPKNILSFAEKMILWDLSDRFGNNGEIYPSNSKIQEATALEPKTVLNCMSSLKRKKFIWYKKQHNSNRRYIQIFDPVYASKYDPKNHPIPPPLLVPRLSLVRDSTIPGQGYSYNRKDQKKEPTTTPKSIPEVPKNSSIKKSDFVVVGSNFEDLKNRVRDDLRNDFNQGTYTTLLKSKLNIGQMKTVIDDLNASNAKSCGWLIGRIKNIDPSSIQDFDEIEKQRLVKEAKAKKILEARNLAIEKNNRANTQKQSDFMSKYFDKYNSLEPDRKKMVFEKIVSRTFQPDIRREMVEAGIDGICSIVGVAFKIKQAIERPVR